MINTPDSSTPLGVKSKCKAPACRAVVYWRPNPKTKGMMPYDPDGRSHFSSCKDLEFVAARKKAKKERGQGDLFSDERGNR